LLHGHPDLGRIMCFACLSVGLFVRLLICLERTPNLKIERYI